MHAGESAAEEEIKQFCKGQVCSVDMFLEWYPRLSFVCLTNSLYSHYFIFQIAHFKIPRYIKFVDEFPLTVTGKVRTGGRGGDAL